MDYIPVIDLEGITKGDKDNQRDVGSISISITQDELPRWKRAASEIRKALSGIGFMYLKNHGISEEVISEAFSASKLFFHLPTQVKSKYRKNPDVSGHGWVQPGQELLHPNSTHELRESFDVAGHQRFYPTLEEHPNFGEAMEQLEQEGNRLMRTLLKLVGLSLDLEDSDYFIKCCRHLDSKNSSPIIRNECDLRAIYYPVVNDGLQVPRGAVRCAEHTDYEILTLLFQDEMGGLEVKDVNGKWIAADPLPNAILVNTGDLLQFWTNGSWQWQTPQR